MDELYPSTFVLLWPWEEEPTGEEVRLRLQEVAEGQPMGPLEESDVLWASAFERSDEDAPVLVWARPAQPQVESWLSGKSITWGDGEEASCRSARWQLGIETMLDPAEPLESYHRQLRFCHTLCGELPGLFDLSSTLFRSGAQIRRMVSTQVPPRTSELYQIHAILDDGGEQCWLHTHGLQRAGVPDLEMIGAPREHYVWAGNLIRYFVDQFLGDDLPEPEVAFRLGFDLQAAWIPLDAKLEQTDSEALGGEEDRADGQHGGVRAVLVEPGSLEPPLAALELLDSGDAVAFASSRETARMAQLARERWSLLGMAYVRRKNDEGWKFLVKLGYEVDEDPESREHLWFEVLEIVPDRVRARLLNQPLGIARLQQGEEGWHDLDRLSDWVIQTPEQDLTPDTIDPE